MKTLFLSFSLYLVIYMGVACQTCPQSQRQSQSHVVVDKPGEFKKKTYYTSSVKVDTGNVALDSLQSYFPVIANDDSTVYKKVPGGYGVFVAYTRGMAVDSFHNRWYSKKLFALKEPLLYNRPLKKKEVIRFLWLPTFHNPVAVRMERKGEDVSLYWKRTNGAGGYGSGNLVVDRYKKVGMEEWYKLMQLLNEASFWTPKLVPEKVGCDGSQWIIEAGGPDYYHLQDVWCGGRLMPAGKYLLSLTDMALTKDEIY